MARDHDSITLTLPASGRLVVLVAGVLLASVLVVLIAVLASLEGTRSEIRTTRMELAQANRRIETISAPLAPLLTAVGPLATPTSRRQLGSDRRALTDAARQVPGLAQSTQQAAGAAGFIADTLAAADLRRALADVTGLSDTALSGNRLGRLLDAADTLLSGHGATGLASLLPDLSTALRGLGEARPRSSAACDAHLRRDAPNAPGQMACLLHLAPDLRALLRAQRHLNAISATTQVRTLDVLRQSLSIQREILAHVRSIDRKFVAPSAPATG